MSSSPASITWDMAPKTRDLIEDNWDSANTDEPQYIELVKEDDKGDARKRVRRHNEYILFAEQGERTSEYADIFWNTRNLSTEVYAEVSTAKSRTRLNNLFGEIDRIAMDARTRNSTIGTPGGWDNLRISASFFDDEQFGWHVAEITFTYTKRKDTI